MLYCLIINFNHILLVDSNFAFSFPGERKASKMKSDSLQFNNSAIDFTCCITFKVINILYIIFIPILHCDIPANKTFIRWQSRSHQLHHSILLKVASLYIVAFTNSQLMLMSHEIKCCK